MPQGEKKRQSLQRWVHGHHGIRHAADAEGDDAPERGETQTHAEGGEHGKHEDTESLRSDDAQKHHQQHGRHTAMAGEMEHPIESDGEGDAYEEENERLRKQFSRQGVEHRAAGHDQPVVHRVVFHLRSDTEHGHHEDEQHEESRKDDVREIHIIIQPRVVDGVGVNHDGLQKGHRLSFRSAFGIEHRARGRPRSEFRHRAHVAIEQRAGHEVRIVRVE